MIVNRGLIVGDLLENAQKNDDNRHNKQKRGWKESNLLLGICYTAFFHLNHKPHFDLGDRKDSNLHLGVGSSAFFPFKPQISIGNGWDLHPHLPLERRTYFVILPLPQHLAATHIWKRAGLAPAPPI